MAIPPVSSSSHSSSSSALAMSSSSSSSFVVRDFSLLEELEEIVQLASNPIPERPDGIVVVAKYTSSSRAECQTTEADYERLARENPATIFLRCFEEYDNSHLIFGQVDVTAWPTYDVFYGGNRVARVEGPSISSLEEALDRFQFSNSDLDLFSEDANKKRQLQWGDGQKKDMTKTPRTTARFVPGYDWNKKVGAFDEVGEKAQQSFEDTFGNWLPPMDDDDDDDGKKSGK
eukprot:CAMPEP_0113448812 /NCGR_PEP_ID=MMETSP0014_2-20120614/4966_1 /TAXON_ID=2857 /ORGANISM="Nitzschia sp." /LENGTH=230 /DNA_ID=CAMNT_0000340049 /DNA_START=145 /DNA_END=837 /DNA_ORIENTATION=- /assembly_acc=CAM_ASM_000159